MSLRARPASSDRLPSALGPRLVTWFGRTARPLPWRRDHDPYHVWLGEVLLQQTRVAQATPYYERFLARFPNIDALAAARREEVLKAWEGAGYYARARHLHAAAQEVVRRHAGQLPTTVPELEELPGVGPYIARAVASIAGGAPTIALEANGLRVAARWTLERGDGRTSRVRSRLERALEGLLRGRPAGPFNEAMMELGETLCLPVRPRCGRCPVEDLCRARRELPDPGSIPRRRSRSRRPLVRAAVVVLEDSRGRWFVQRRPEHGLLGGLWEFPGGKIEAGESPGDAAARELREETGLAGGPLRYLGTVRHGYSHFSVELHVFRGTAAGRRPRPGSARRWVGRREFGRLPIPKATEKVARLLR